MEQRPRRLVKVTKHISFDCAHFLLNPEWTREENIAKFHKCCLYKEDGQDEPHGHTYHLEVTVYGFVDDDTGFVIDFKDLKQILNDGVVERLDHRLINNIPFFKDKLATVENILYYIWEYIAPQIDGLRPQEAQLHELRMWETPDSFATLSRVEVDWENKYHKRVEQINSMVENKKNDGRCNNGGCCR